MRGSNISFGAHLPRGIQRARAFMDRHGAAFLEGARTAYEIRALSATLRVTPAFSEHRASVIAPNAPSAATRAIEGLACRYGRVARIENYGRVFFEEGCFARPLADGSKIRMLVDHDNNQELLSTIDADLHIEAFRGLGLVLRLPVEDRHRNLIDLIEGGRDCLSVGGHIRTSRRLYSAASDGTDGGILHIDDFEITEVSLVTEGAVLDAWCGVTDVTEDELFDVAWSDRFHQKILAGHDKTARRRIRRFTDRHGLTLDQSNRLQTEQTEALQGRLSSEIRT